MTTPLKTPRKTASSQGKRRPPKKPPPEKGTALDERLLSILDTAPDPVVVIDQTGIIRSFNKEASKVFGYEPTEVVGRNVSMLMPSPDRERHDSYIARYLKTNEPRIIGVGREVMALRKDGTVFPVRLAISEARLDGTRTFTAFMHDLSAQRGAENDARQSSRRSKELQEQLILATRHGELGEMASAIAHELNQPLTAVLNYVETCLNLLEARDGPAIEQITEYLGRTAVQAERAGIIIRRLRQLYERRDVEKVPDDLNSAVEEALDLALVGARVAGADVKVDLAPNLDPVVMDRQQIQQVVINLVRNALEAVEHVHERRLTIATRRVDGSAVELTVSDTGPGIADEVADELFRPFRTTKPDGMGLGLSICRTIVDGHNGTISAESEPGEGTTFHVVLQSDGGGG